MCRIKPPQPFRQWTLIKFLQIRCIKVFYLLLVRICRLRFCWRLWAVNFVIYSWKIFIYIYFLCFYKRLAIRLAVAHGFAFVEIDNIYRGAKAVYSNYFTTIYGLFVYDIYSVTRVSRFFHSSYQIVRR